VGCQRKGEVKMKVTTRPVHDKYLALLFLAMVIITGVLFTDFILHKRFFIFNSIGGDTRQSYWPMYKYLIDSITEGTLRSWSFQLGLGTSTFTLYSFLFDPFFLLLFLFPQGALPYGILVIALIKIFLSGYLFFLYINLFAIKKFPAVIASLIWAFNGYMMLWGQHYWFATMLVFFTFLMFSIECWLRGRNKYLFPISIAMLGINSPYFLFMISIFLFFYLTFHFLLTSEEIRFRNYFQMVVRFFGSYFLGLGAAAVVFLPVCYLIINSPRMSASFLTGDIFQLATYKEYVSIFLRLFSNNTLGSEIPYFGSINYYEGPMLSSSLLTIIILPQLLFLKMSKKNKSIISLVFILCIVLFIFPIFSSMFSAFSSFNYRWNFFIILLMVLSIGHVLQKVAEQKKISYLGLLLSTIFVVIGWYYSYKIMIANDMIPQNYIELRYIQGMAKWIALFLVFYALFMIVIKKNHQLIWLALTVVVSAELIQQNYQTINHRSTVPVNIEETRVGYYDYTNDAIQYLNTIDEDLFRVDKNYDSYSFNDSLFQHYNGIKAYNSLNHPSYFSFLKGVDTELNDHNLINGFDRRSVLRNLVGVKYVLSKDEHVPFGYEKLTSFQDVHVYKNPYALPIGFTYDSYITEESFSTLSPIQKDEVLLNAVVVAQPKELKRYVLNKEGQSFIIKDILVTNGELKQKGPGDFEIQALNHDPNIYLSLPPHNGQLKIEYELEGPDKTSGQFFWKNNTQQFTNETRMFYLDVTDKSRTSAFDIYAENISEIRIDPGQLVGMYKIKNLKLHPINYGEIAKNISELSENSLQIKEYTNNFIKGTLTLQKEEMLFLSIPYDKGWKLTVDNKPVPTEKVNEGFIGAMIPKGVHQIELQYHQPLVKVGLIITILCWGTLLVLIVISYIKPRRSKVET
jgi:uncharacterized membrane protein YfhO